MLKSFLILILCSFTTLIAQNNSDHFQIGIYGLQSPVGTKGFANGKLNEVRNDIDMVKSDINAAYAMRSWNRKRYSKWDFSQFFVNYMHDMYLYTKDEKGQCGIQVLTPGIYLNFSEPIIEGTIENEKGYDRYLNKELLKKFVFKILDEEFKMVKKEVKSDSKTVEILTSSSKRPFLGWYLDDEPLVRNHDLSVIIDMAWYFRDLEKDFFKNHKVLKKYPKKLEKYHRPRYIAFDGDDLHRHKRSGRAKDALSYNMNGKQFKFSKNQIYTVFPEDVVDVLMIDFYIADPTFWNKILADVDKEYNIAQRKRPKVMPIIFTNFKKKYKSSYGNKYYADTFNQLKKLDIDGIWMYQWIGDKNSVGGKDIWNSGEIKLNKFIKSIE